MKFTHAILFCLLVWSCQVASDTDNVEPGEIGKSLIEGNIVQYYVHTSAGQEIEINVDRNGQLLGIYTTLDDSTTQFFSFSKNLHLESRQFLSKSGRANGRVYNFHEDSGDLEAAFTVVENVPYGLSKTYYSGSGALHQVAYLDDEGRYDKLITLSPDGDTLGIDD